MIDSGSEAGMTGVNILTPSPTRGGLGRGANSSLLARTTRSFAWWFSSTLHTQINTKKLPEMDSLESVALNESAVFASKNYILFRKSPPLSAPSSLEPQEASLGGSHPHYILK